jgi:eukaryotic-like serine/threonine-protein kinase
MESGTGERQFGRYQIVEELGHGGMGVVYRAHDNQLGRDVALKVLGEALVQQDRYRRRLVREARAAAAITHPAIATVYDVGEREGEVFIAMELVAGKSLHDLIETGAMSTDEALRIASVMADALHVAHQVGVVHRDIKPDNVMITDRGDVKILDFGIARVEEREAPISGDADTLELARARGPTTLTGEGAIIGTPGYMSPEQVLGLAVGAKSDIFSLGVTLYEMLSGQCPFGGTTAMEIAVAVTRDEPHPLGNLRPELGAEIVQLVERCLHKVPAARYSTSALRDELERLRRSPPTPLASSPPMTVGASAGLATMKTAEAPGTGPPKPVVDSRVVYLALAGGLVILLAILWRTTGSAERPQPRPAPSASSSGTSTPITALPGPTSGNQQAMAAYKSALQAFRDGSWQRARKHLEQAVEHDPSLAIAQLRLAMTYGGEEGLADLARKAFRAAAAGRHQLGARDVLLLDAYEPVMLRTPPAVDVQAERLAAASVAYPRDAEFAFLAAITKQLLGDLDGALPFARRASALDAHYADGWQVLGIVQARLGRSEEAIEAFERCVDTSATAADCLVDLMVLHSLAGACDQVLRHARAMVARSGEFQAYHWLATALAATGAGDEAVGEALTQAKRQASSTDTDYQPLVLDVQQAIWRGDFVRADELAGALAQAAEAHDDLGVRALATMWQVEVANERGDTRSALEVASNFVNRRAAMAIPPNMEPWMDPTPALLSQLRRDGSMSDGDHLDHLLAWRQGWSSRLHDDARLWLFGKAVPAFDEPEARAALATRPAEATPARLYRGAIATAHIGRVLALAGKRTEGVDMLRAATRDCRVLFEPHVVMRARLDLATALAATALADGGDTAEACRELDVVGRKWGQTQTARRAARLRTSLPCPP